MRPADNSTYPYGALPKFLPRDERHRDLFSGHEAAPFVLTTFTNSVWFAKRPHELELFLGKDQQLILANVEQDELLKNRTPDEEMQRVELLEPDFYIPSDRWVYEDTMTRADQMAEIDRCMAGTREIYHRIAAHDGLSTLVIPIAKGWERWHFARCRRTFDDLGLTYIAFDVTQYPSVKPILEDVLRLIDVIEPRGILLIGRLSPDDLKRCPPEVVAATGVDHWRKNCQLSTGGFSRERFSQWAEEANEALNVVQSRLDRYQDQSDKDTEQIHGKPIRQPAAR